MIPNLYCLKEIPPESDIRIHFSPEKKYNLKSKRDIGFLFWAAHWKEKHRFWPYFSRPFWNRTSQSKVTAPQSRRPWKKRDSKWIKLWVSHFRFQKQVLIPWNRFDELQNRYGPHWLCSESNARIEMIRNLLCTDPKSRFSVIQIRIWLNRISGGISFKRKGNWKFS